MRNLTLTEYLFIWRTGSTRMRLALLCWILGLRGLAVQVIGGRIH
jgi:hypothetical protein